MAKRINKPEQLPEWFNLERYEALLSLSVRDFVCQLERRMIIPGPHRLAKWIIDELSQGVKITCLDELSRRNGKKEDRLYEENNLAEKSAVKPLTNIQLAEYDRRARFMGVYGEYAPKGSGRYMEYDGIIYDRERACKSVDLEPDDTTILPVLIGLSEATDDEIISSFKALLPLWRKQLNAPEPPPGRERAGLSILTRLVEYQAIPMMDLILWEAFEGARVTNDLMARVLFPDHSRGGQHVAQTNRPFVSEMMKGDGYESLLLALDKEPHIYDWTVSDFMKWQA